MFGCDVCQEVCPYTGAAAVIHDADFSPVSVDNAFPRLAWLLTMSEAEYRSVFAKTAVLRAKRRGMARNAAVALGNTGDRAVTGILSDALLRHDEPLVRGHAAWALSQIGGKTARGALERAARQESDVQSKPEIDWALRHLV